MSGENIWTGAEREAWRWPDHLKPSEWAEKYRILQGGDNAEPGPWKNERNPLIADIMDVFVEPGVEVMTVRKAGQVGWSEGIRNMVGWCIDAEPGPALMVMPDQKSAEQLFEERLFPLIEHTPQVGRHASARAWDTKKHSIRFDTMSVYAAWAGSSQSTKSRQIRYAFCDEPDEYPQHSGTGGDPISKVAVRLTTFAAKKRARLLVGGTPTTRVGNVCKHFDLANQRRYAWVPCPKCGTYQRLEWKRVKWPSREELGETDRVKHASRILGEDLAWYECENPKCKFHCLESEHKSRMLQQRVWAADDQAVVADTLSGTGRVVGPKPRSNRHVAMHYPAQYSPWVRWSQMAAEWILAQDNPAALMDFVNQRLAEPWEQSRQKTDPDAISKKLKITGVMEPGKIVVPRWARWIIATADTQGNTEQDGYFWYVVRAWGFGERSQGLDFGVAHSKEELIERTLGRTFPIEGSGAAAGPMGLWPDSGGPRYKEVYELSQANPRVHPTKGSAAPVVGMVEEKPQPKHGIVLWLIDPERARDQLNSLIHNIDPLKWMPPPNANEDYCTQLASKQKLFNPQTGREEWTAIPGRADHLLDCESNGAAIAWRLGCWKPEPVEVAPNPSQKAEAFNPLAYRGKW